MTAAGSDLGWALAVLQRAYQDAVHAAVGDLPHGYRCYQVLRAVERCDQPSQLALAEHLGIDRTVMTYLVDDLVAAGLVERRLDPTDRRCRRVVPTDLGRSTLTGRERLVDQAADTVLASLPEADRVALRDLLDRVASDVRAADPTLCEVADGTRAAGVDLRR